MNLKGHGAGVSGAMPIHKIYQIFILSSTSTFAGSLWSPATPSFNYLAIHFLI